MENRNARRLRLKKDEFDLIQKYRRIKEESIAAGINPDDVKHVKDRPNVAGKLTA